MRRRQMLQLCFTILLIAVSLPAVASTPVRPPHWALSGDSASKTYTPTIADSIGGIPSNSVIDMEISSPYIWLATGVGLARFAPVIGAADPSEGDWFVSTHEDEGFGRGGVSAVTAGVTAWGDPVIWAATAYDSLASGDELPTGGGVGFSLDDGLSWTWMPQPVDSLNETEFEPTVTPIQNVTYDISILGDRVWISSWGGGIRYFDMFDGMQNADPGELVWVNQPPDTVDFDVLNQNNHRGFSTTTMVEDSLLWVGTAAGINLSRDNGGTWQNFRYSSQNENTPCGDFVPSMGSQLLADGRHLLWAGCWVVSAEAGQFYGVSVTDNEGATWRRVLGSAEIPIRAHNFAFQDSIVYVATDDGLYKSADFGETWGLFPNPIDLNNGERFFTDQLYAVAYGFDRLWVGGPDGVGISDNGGNEWSIERTSTDLSGNDDTYAYPNPFSPERFPVVRMHYTMPQAGEVTIEIYDFAMELLIRPVNGEFRGLGEHNDVWDGHDARGGEIANGVYFFRVEGGGQERWGKILVMD